MGEFATLTLLKDYANVFVVSPEYEPSDGWGDVWKSLPQWYASTNDTWSIAKAIVDGYADYYKQNEPSCQFCYSTDIALTAIKRKAVESLRQSFEQFAESLYKTALNEKENGQMYEVFRYYFDNNLLSSADRLTFWGDATILGESPSDSIAKELYQAIPIGTDYVYAYGYSGDNSISILGFDLLDTVQELGLASRAVELGYTGFLNNYKVGDADNQHLTPEYDPLTDDRAVAFIDTYNSTVSNDQLYTKYLYIDYDPSTVPEERKGSGLGLIYPYTSPLQASSPKLELCNYQNFVESYNGTLPNYAGFVKTVSEEMWKAVKDSGLSAEFSCDSGSGNVVWEQE